MSFSSLLAQRSIVYNQFFNNPVVYNPSFIGNSGFTELYINHRQQWLDVDGAPVMTHLSFQLPLNRKLSVGAILSSDKRGLITTYEGQIGASYSVNFNDQTSLTFGLTAGTGRNSIESSINDQALNNNNNSLFPVGQFGMNFKLKALTVSFALPQLFETELFAEEIFEDVGIDITQTTFSNISYRFTISPQFDFEPNVFFQTFRSELSQYGGLGTLYYKDLFWIGGGYMQDVGPSAHLGMNVSDFLRFGYAYDFAPDLAASFGQGSHEFQIVLRLDKKNKRKTQPITEPAIIENETLIITEKEEKKEETPEQPGIEVIDKTDTKKTEKKTAPVDKQSQVEVPEQEIEEEETYEEADPAESETEPEESSERMDNIVKVDLHPQNEGISKGYYIVVGAFAKKENARNHLSNISNAGYEGAIGYSPITGYNYVYLRRAEKLEDIVSIRGEIRSLDIFDFKNAWILHIE